MAKKIPRMTWRRSKKH